MLREREQRRLLRSRRGIRVAVIAAALAGASAAWTGCRGTATQGAASGPEQHMIRGTVVSTDPAHASIVLRHGAIPGFMEAMTMEYPVSDRSVAAELHPGDGVMATLDVDRSGDGAMKMQLTGIDVVAQARPDYKPAMQYHVPEPGDAVPDFKLLDQSDKTIGLAQYRGKVLVMTFVYTRCPLADFCPRMSHQFAEIDKALGADPGLYAKTHLLSVSFDPEHDTPQVLRSYGGAYTGKYVNETFNHWSFAAPSQAELPKVEQFFDLGVTPGGNGALQHSLATLVIGKDGKVAAFWPGNDWTVPEVMARVRQAAAA
jgi:protein SCO1/2